MFQEILIASLGLLAIPKNVGIDIENAYGKVLIDMYQKQLLEDTGEYNRLTEKGIDVSNYVMSEFLF